MPAFVDLARDFVFLRLLRFPYPLLVIEVFGVEALEHEKLLASPHCGAVAGFPAERYGCMS